MDKNTLSQTFSKVPEVTLIFWIIKIAATTLGETAGDALSMSLNFGYILSTCIFSIIFIGFVALQMKARQYKPFLYWATIISTTTLGTTIADFVDRSLGIGYFGGSTLLLILLLASLAVWYQSCGNIAVNSVQSTKSEAFYWITIMFSQTLGTALGDWTADTQGLGYTASALIFGSLLLMLAAFYYWTQISRTLLFWSAFVLTRPLGAVLGDFLDKPLDHGGLDLSRFGASFVLLAFIVMCLMFFKSKPASTAH
ncbi:MULTISPECIES: COG4705 family protein [Acinetobacter]|uniref:COG4705 family protein n=1 Tax=Acinetobacter TaxID=469 RepID=UPI0005C64541|nr:MULTISPECIES: membrane protein [Acinetobacter]